MTTSRRYVAKNPNIATGSAAGNKTCPIDRSEYNLYFTRLGYMINDILLVYIEVILLVHC